MRSFLLIATLLFGVSTLIAEDAPVSHSPASPKPKRFESFTGKIVGNNVRMRLSPNLDGHVFKELERDDLVLVTGLVDDFYACTPPKNLKGYIFRTYVLDGVVEGTNVFVRLGPDRASPAVAQLSSGDVVKGCIASQNNKWLQIELPEQVRFYVAKDYVKQVGDEAYFSRNETRKIDVQKTLADLEHQLDSELQKPFSKIQLAPLAARLSQLINDNKDLPQAVSQAEALISRMQESYLAKSVAAVKEEPIAEESTIASAEVVEQKQPPQQSGQIAPAPAKPLSTASWQEREAAIMQAAIEQGKASSEETFYDQEQKRAETLRGIIKPYSSFISTRPGDFVLINAKTNLPVAYLYSTKVDLASAVNKQVILQVSSRPNNNFAFPAFFVLKVEE